MFKVRAKTKDGKEVVGWYYHAFGFHCLIEETGKIHTDIDLSAAAVEAGRDKNGGPVYGNRGDFRGGDKVQAEWQCPVVFDLAQHVLRGTLEYDENAAMWMFDYGHGAVPLGSNELAELEIIEEGKCQRENE